MRKKAMIFDMDNTILHSRIDYERMKQVTFDYLRDGGYYPPDYDYLSCTTAQLIDDLKADHRLRAEDEKGVWEAIEKVEREGMRRAEAEPGALQVLQALQPVYHIHILTNNAGPGSLLALSRCGLLPFVDKIVCREEVKRLKPDAEGAKKLLAIYPDIPVESWYYVGDFWADGAAAQGAGIRFIAYRANRRQMAEKGVAVWRHIEDLDDLLDILPMGKGPDIR